MDPGLPRNRCWIAARSGVEAWSSAWTGHAPPRHSHDAYQISFTRAGLGQFVVRGRSSPSPAGNLVIIEPGQVHEVYPDGGSSWTFDTLYLDEESIDGLAGDPARRGERSAAPTADDRLATRFSLLHRAIVDRSPIIEQEDRLVGLVQVIDGLRHEPPPSKIPETSLHRVRDFLDECPEPGVSLADLAALADLSPSHLSRSFRREFGLPPHAYLIQVRVSRARTLLRRGMPVIEVATCVGFADQAHLTRHFRRLVGVTPGHYRSGSTNVQDRPDRQLYPW